MLIRFAIGQGGGTEGQPSPEPVSVTAPAASASTMTTGAATQPDSEVPPIDCSSLLSSDETAAALAIFDRPSDQRDSFLFSQGEVCGSTLVSDEDFFVRIEPGSPDDFGPGARLSGTNGEMVDEVGDGALWFGGDQAEGGGEVGLLSVRQETPLGALHFRIVLGRPDLDDTARQEMAVGLALDVLPRFPGVEVEAPEPQLVIFEEEAPDRARISLYDNLLAREESGEWTMAQGLVATLGLVAGETEASQVLGDLDLLDRSASDVIALAQEYLEIGTDQSAKDEIARLLGLLLLSPEQLEQMSSEEPSEATALVVSLVPVAQEEDPCAILGMTAPCVAEILLPETEGVPNDKYTLYASLGQGSPWTVDRADVAKEAVLETAGKYEALGDMPVTTILLHPEAWNYVSSQQHGCIVYLGSFTSFEDAEFQQIVAREMAFCLIGQHFFSAVADDPAGANWWVRGLANYLSGYVYPSVNLEHQTLPAQLASQELSTTLADRGYTNWVFFEHIHGAIEVEGIMALIDAFPHSGDQIAALAAYPGMADLFHSFERGLTDANVKDLGPGTVPYDPIAWDLPLTGPTEVPFDVPRFGVRRLHVTVPSGSYACFETTQSGEQEVSWRPGGPGEPGTWDSLPSVLEGEGMIVITAVEPGARFEMDVSDVDDDPDCSDEEDSPPPDDCDLEIVCQASRYFFNVFRD